MITFPKTHLCSKRVNSKAQCGSLRLMIDVTTVITIRRIIFGNGVANMTSVMLATYLGICGGTDRAWWRLHYLHVWLRQSALTKLITSPAGAVAKYCDKYVCVRVCVSVCLCVCEDNSGTTRAIFANFCACWLWPWLGPPPVSMRYVMYFRFCGRHHVFQQ